MDQDILIFFRSKDFFETQIIARIEKLERAKAKMLENINNYTLLLTIIQPY
ncbi:hypothetical protein WwAna0589, partial [Wolbachia endosymbiont of Drosophila ananassae]